MKRTLKALTSLALATCLMAGLVACGDSSAQQSAAPGSAQTEETPITLTCAITMSEDSVYYKDLAFLQEELNKQTDSITLDIQFGGVLGGETEYIEGLQAGTIDAMIVSFSPLSATSPKCGMFEIPYLINGFVHLNKVWDSDIGDEIRADLSSVGIRALGVLDFGYRETTNNVRPINTPDDMKGIKFRTTTSDLRLAVFEALGAQPVSMSFSEVFTGLQQNVIDGQESPLSTIDSSSFAEVQKYLSLTGHFWTNECLLINEKLWDSLPEEWQTILQEEVDACETRIREKNVQSDEELVAKLESEGMEVNEVDKAAFAEQLQPLYDEWEGKVIGSDLMNAYREYSGY